MTGIYTGFYQIHYKLPRSFYSLKNNCYTCQRSKQPVHTEQQIEPSGYNRVFGIPVPHLSPVSRILVVFPQNYSPGDGAEAGQFSGSLP